MERIKKSLDTFFKSDMRVAVVKGKWGVGKTYFWDKYIKSKIDSKNWNQVAYSYVSLFGSSKLSDIKQTVFQSSIPNNSKNIADKSFDKEFKEKSQIYNQLPWLYNAINVSKRKASHLGRITRFLNNTLVLNQYSSLIPYFEYSMINNYLICIDDIERKGDSLPIKEVMGLVDEFVQKKSCKVILVFNENALDDEKDKGDFEKYREKIVDIELDYSPSFEHNLQCVIKSKEPYYKQTLKLLKELNIKNIRVIKKIKWVLDEFWEYVQAQDPRLINEWLTHVTLFCWAYYKTDDALPFEFVREELFANSWISLLSDSDKEQKPENKRFNTIATNLSLSSAVYDEDIIALLQNGFVDKDKFQGKIHKLSQEIDVNKVRERLHQAWEMYSSSFEDNLDDFITELKSILDCDIENLDIGDFSSTIDILDEYEEDVVQYIDQYTKAHNEYLQTVNLKDPWSIKRIQSEPLLEKIKGIQAKSNNKSIDNVALKIVKNGWNPEDIEFLSLLSVDDYYKWMMSKPTNMVDKIRSGLLRFQTVQINDDKEKYSCITTNVTDALKKIAGKNEYNKKRVKSIYGIEFDD